MFDRKKYKSFAKQQLQGRWGIPILISVIITIITSIFAIPDMIRTLSESANMMAAENMDQYVLAMSELSASRTSFISTIIQTIVSGILSIASLNVYIQTSGYWINHYTFGGSTVSRPKTLSNSSIDLLIINSIVPFLYAY
ncbi:MAG: DUF2851 family protein, partial [Treponema sp.]|nr:DUF2851 family protein [Treponema sp.]